MHDSKKFSDTKRRQQKSVDGNCNDRVAVEKRRQALKGILAGGVVAASQVPTAWTKPVIESVTLPAHAASSPPPSGTQRFDTAGSDTFTVPPGVTSITVECYGGGGGTRSATNGTRGGGGGGGAYASVQLAVSPGDSFPVVVGAGGAAFVGNYGLGGGTSSFGTGPQCSAAGGQGGSNTFNSSIDYFNAFGFPASEGGLAANSVGTITANGGNGGDRGSDVGGGGGASGSAAGAGAAGSAGVSPNGGAGGVGVSGGGSGGQGGDNGVAGEGGFAPGGGAGGPGIVTANTGGANGADGAVVVNW